MLAEHRVGRLAYRFRDRVDIEPIGFVFDGESLIFRTVPGSRLEMLRHGASVALEMDELRDSSDWQSVVVHGKVSVIHNAGTDTERAVYRDAVAVLERAIPGTAAALREAPDRGVVMRLRIDRVGGRAAGPRPA
jgi:nitroimidazol reductase NimA-like FMN-containing flavoprotein (pyridoxamine 5'-phosphate oxidase superfamily)